MSREHVKLLQLPTTREIVVGIHISYHFISPKKNLGLKQGNLVVRCNKLDWTYKHLPENLRQKIILKLDSNTN